MTFADAVGSSIERRSLMRLYDLALVVGGSLFIALSSWVAVPLPFSPVPVTGQTLAVLLVGVLLGARRGALSLLLYLAEGAMGLPVFAAGASGITRIMGPTGGYLRGFVAAAFVVGWLAERGWDRRIGSAALAMLIGNATIYLFGLSWLARFTGAEQVLPLGLYPFLAGDVVKLVLATVGLAAGWKVLPSQGGERLAEE